VTVKVLKGAKSPLNGATWGKQGDPIWMYEVPFTPMWDLRVDPNSSAFSAVNAALGLTLPTTVGKVARVNASCMGQPEYEKDQKGIIALCLGPDQWLLTGTADASELLEHVRAIHHISLVDISAQRTKLEVSGPKSVEVLEHVWEQDLRKKNFGIDSCSQGIMFRTPVIMWYCCTDCYILFVRSSFAEHLWAALTDATVEYL
jgi:sarcosine oxidase subunit gamma